MPCPLTWMSCREVNGLKAAVCKQWLHLIIRFVCGVAMPFTGSQAPLESTPPAYPLQRDLTASEDYPAGQSKTLSFSGKCPEEPQSWLEDDVRIFVVLCFDTRDTSTATVPHVDHWQPPGKPGRYTLSTTNKTARGHQSGTVLPVPRLSKGCKCRLYCSIRLLILNSKCGCLELGHRIIRRSSDWFFFLLQAVYLVWMCAERRA